MLRKRNYLIEGNSKGVWKTSGNSSKMSSNSFLEKQYKKISDYFVSKLKPSLYVDRLNKSSRGKGHLMTVVTGHGYSKNDLSAEWSLVLSDRGDYLEAFLSYKDASMKSDNNIVKKIKKDESPMKEIDNFVHFLNSL